MLETMHGADGAGLATPQAGQPLSIFVADLSAAWKSLPRAKRPDMPPQPMVCIKPGNYPFKQK